MNEGKVLAGISAGSICWFEEGITDSYGDRLEPIHCLGFLKGSNCPHYDGEKERLPAYHEMIKLGKISAGIATDDGAGVHYINGTVHQVVSSRKNAKAYRVFRKGNQVIEETVQTKYLGDDFN